MVVHFCYPSYMRGREGENYGFEASLGKTITPYLKNN
jgi:hypothetical protein